MSTEKPSPIPLIANALQDGKSGTAAWDDTRITIAQLCDEHPDLFETRDLVDLQYLRSSMGLVIERGDSIVGALARIIERMQQ